MVKSTGEVLIIDLEATCWETDPPKGEQSDIIQIGGIVLSNRTWAIQDRINLIVRPERSTVSAFCTQLTGLTAPQVERGMGLKEAVTQLSHYRNIPWGSWGDYDRTMLRRCCDAYGLQYPLGDRHTNIKTLYALWAGRAKEVGMDRALEQLKMPLIGRHHDGADDALNIARVFVKVLGYIPPMPQIETDAV
jgi:inhibitor of KinA sporulation pathway (predicted exonuclease)